MNLKVQDRNTLTRSLGTFGLYLLFLLPLLASCGLETRSRLDIIAGKAPTQDDPALLSTIALIDATTGVPFCSGTYIAQNLVVTAAHCVIDREREAFKVMFDKTSFPVTSFQTYKPVQKFESNFDIAWVKFDGTPADRFRPIEILNSASPLQSGREIEIAGYGYTQYPCGEETVPCDNSLLQSLKTQVKEYISGPRLYSLITVDSKGVAGPCFGDSGGSAFVWKDGKWYLAGEFMGWDRILVPENLDTICNSGEGIYTFVGNYSDWIEKSSNTPIPYNAQSNPRPLPPREKADIVNPKTFEEWCQKENNEDPSWYTVQKIIRLASDFRIETEDPSKARELFEDCSVAGEWVTRMVSSQKRLSLSTFDREDANYNAKVEDLRPILSLAGLGVDSITIADSAIRDFRPLSAFPSLTKLEIKNNQVQTIYPIDVSQFKKLSELLLSSDGGAVDMTTLTEAKALSRLELTGIEIPDSTRFDFSGLENLLLDQITSNSGLDLSSATQVSSLSVASTKLVALPAEMPKILSLVLRHSSGSAALPIEMPRLKNLSLIGVDLSGEITLKRWKDLQDVFITGSSKLRSVQGIEGLPSLANLSLARNSFRKIAAIRDLPNLRSLDLSDNGLTTLPVMGDLPGLRDLNLSDNKIQDMQDLPSSLEEIDLSGNPPDSVQAIRDLPQLRQLILDHMQDGLSSLSGIGDLPTLEDLSLMGNQIKDVNELSKLKRLKTVNLNYNLIEDLSPLFSIEGLSYIEAIGNPLKEMTCHLQSGKCRLTLFPNLVPAPAPPVPKNQAKPADQMRK